MNPKWILVAHRGGARLFHLDPAEKELSLNVKIDFSQAHARNKAQPHWAKLTNEKGSGPGLLPKDQDAAHLTESLLANELAELLRKKHDERGYNEIILIAGPQLLGRIKAALDKEVSRAVTMTYSKDLAHCRDSEILEHLDLVELESASLEHEASANA